MGSASSRPSCRRGLVSRIPSIITTLGYTAVKKGIVFLPWGKKMRSLFLTANDRRIAALENCHWGKRCFIIGNGPSLQIEDLNRLYHEITFASNKIYLAFTETSWRPTYYTVTDIILARNNAHIIEQLPLPKIFASSVKSVFKHTPDITWLYNYRMNAKDNTTFKFSKDLVLGVWGGFSVVYHQLQLAYYMGISEVYLLGIDFDFTISKRSGQYCEHGEILEAGGEQNHFHPDYRQPGETWTMPRLDMQEKAFICARRAFESDDRHIYNASRKTALDVFTRISLDQVLLNPFN